jgi:hypothetical protein
MRTALWRTQVKLAKPFRWHDETVNELELKEPTGALYTRLGEPRVLVYNATGSGYYVEQPDVIRAYLEQLVTHELGSDIFAMLGLEDAKALKEALLDFFTDAEVKLNARRATGSSSASTA